MPTEKPINWPKTIMSSSKVNTFFPCMQDVWHGDILEFLKETTHDAHFVRWRLATDILDSAITLKILLLRFHQRFQIVAKRDSCRKEEYLGETEIISLAKDSSTTDEGVTQAIPNWSKMEFQTSEEKEQWISRWFDPSDARRQKGHALIIILPPFCKLSWVKIFPNPAVQIKLLGGALEGWVLYFIII